MFRSAVCAFVFVCFSVCYLHAASYNAPAPYGQPQQPIVVTVPGTSEAQAAAITNDAGAKATAARLQSAVWKALNAYGHEIGVPLLVKPYGPLTSLYAASLPPRSFVGKIDPVFVKDSYGRVKLIDESTIGVVAI